MRVLTYNIHKVKGSFGSRVTTAVLAREIAKRQADLVLCQEVFHRNDPMEDRLSEDQSTTLAGHLGFVRTYGANAVYRRGHHGNATLARFEVLHQENRDLSTNPVEKRGVLHTVFATNDGPLHVFNTHLGLNRWQRERQTRRILDFVNAVADNATRVVLAGDFNDWSGHIDRLMQNESDLQSALASLNAQGRRSFPSRAPIFGLDRIYYRGLDLLDARVLREPSWRELSDHLPVEASFGSSSMRPLFDSEQR